MLRKLSVILRRIKFSNVVLASSVSRDVITSRRGNVFHVALLQPPIASGGQTELVKNCRR